jgi:MFS family permease
MLWGMRQASLLTPLTRPIGWSGAAAVIAGAAMGAPVGARVTCYLTSWLPGTGGCAPGGFPAGALVGALLALVALPLLGQGTRRGEHAAHRPAPTTTTAARLVWLAITAALGRWLAEAVVNPQLRQEGMGGLAAVAWLVILPAVLVAAAGLAMVAQGLLRRRGWARWAAVVAFALLGITALAGLVDWVRVLVVSRARGWEEVTAEMLAVDLVTVVLLLAASVGVIVLLMTPATRRDFQSSRQPPAATNGR